MLVLLRRSQQHALVRRRRRRPCPSCSDADANAYCVALESQTPRRAKGSSSANCVVCWNYLCGDSSLILSLFAYVALFFWLTPKSLERTDLCLFSSEFFFSWVCFMLCFLPHPKKMMIAGGVWVFFFYLHTLVRPSGTPLGVGRRHFSAMGISDGDFVHDFMYSARLLYCCCYFVCWGGSLQQIMYAFMGLGTKFDALAGSEVVYVGKRNDERNITMPPIWWGQPPEIRRTTRLDDPRVSVWSLDLCWFAMFWGFGDLVHHLGEWTVSLRIFYYFYFVDFKF